jgi:hypothetical protein
MRGEYTLEQYGEDDYLVICAGGTAPLQAEVNRLMAEGFKPLGGISTKPARYGSDLLQAMIWEEL